MSTTSSVQFCRLCTELLEPDNLLHLFDESGNPSNVVAVILKHYDVKIHPSEQNAKGICLNCWTITNTFHELYERVRQTEEEHSIGIEHKSQTQFKQEIEIEIAQPIETLSTSRECFSDMPANIEKEEDEDLDGIEDNDDQHTLTSVESDHESLDNQYEDEDYEPNHDDDEDNYADATNIEHTSPSENKTTRKRHANNTNTSAEKPSRKPRRIHQHLYEHQNERIRDYFNMNCNLCGQPFANIVEANEHFRSSHAQPGYLMCCDRKFYARYTALEHIELHLDPDAFRCAPCERTFASKATLRVHLDTHQHDPPAATETAASSVVASTSNVRTDANGDDANTNDTDTTSKASNSPARQMKTTPLHRCDHCAQTFAKGAQLTRHRRKKHGESLRPKLFGCEVCGKFFVNKYVLATHVRVVHENAFAHMCHVCAKTFKSKQVFELHQREHLELDIPKLQCNICGNWLKHEHSLRKHIARHFQSEETCKLCGKKVPNAHALGNHMRYVHSERVYKCTMCEKAFKKPIGLKEHMASHTGLDLYTCPYCTQTFKSSSNMYAHRKKRHLEQWSQDRELRMK